jgi:hypothetical protein
MLNRINTSKSSFVQLSDDKNKCNGVEWNQGFDKIRWKLGTSITIAMNKKQRKTLEKIYQAAALIKWNDFLSLIKHLGGEVEQGAGFRCRIWLNDRAINLHKPHPQPEIKR